MRLNSLRYFLTVAESGSFYAAANESRITAQGLNKVISALEAELGIKLLVRDRSGVRLTAEGEIVRKRARIIQAQYDEMLEELLRHNADSGSTPNRTKLYVSYYSAQIASSNNEYIKSLLSRLSYNEEPFSKLIQRAKASDGTDLVLIDVHSHSAGILKNHPELTFDSLIKTRLGLVWKEGSPLADESLLHRETVSRMPLAVNTYREMAQLNERIFAETPLTDIRMGATSPRMLIEYVQASDETAAIFDSFGFFAAEHDPVFPTDGLHFTPLSTPDALCEVGFLYPKRCRQTLVVQHTIRALKQFLSRICSDYYERYPQG